MVELHSYIAHIRKNPDTRHTPTNRGTLLVCIHIKLATMSTEIQLPRAVFGLTAHFKRNIMAKNSAIPTNEA